MLCPIGVLGYDLQVGLDQLDWMAKNHFNRVGLSIVGDGWKVAEATVLEHVRKRGLEISSGAIFSMWLGPEQFEAHPEFFAYRKDLQGSGGKRVQHGQLCASNRRGIALYGRNAARWTKCHKEIDNLSVGANDFWLFCECDRCARLTNSEQTQVFFNEAAAAIGETDPALRVFRHVYYAYDVPRKIDPPRKMRIVFDSHPRCRWHSLGDKGCTLERSDTWLGAEKWPINQRLKEHLEAWSKQGLAELVEYNNTNQIALLSTPVPNYSVVARDLELFEQLRVDGVILQSFHANFSTFAPNYYLYGRLLWGDRDKDGALKEFCKALYGPASTAVLRYFTALEKKGAGEPPRIYAAMDEAFVRWAYQLLDRTRAKVSEPFHTQNLHKLRQTLDYLVLLKGTSESSQTALSLANEGRAGQAYRAFRDTVRRGRRLFRFLEKGHPGLIDTTPCVIGRNQKMDICGRYLEFVKAFLRAGVARKNVADPQKEAELIFHRWEEAHRQCQRVYLGFESTTPTTRCVCWQETMALVKEYLDEKEVNWVFEGPLARHQLCFPGCSQPSRTPALSCASKSKATARKACR
jgi:hypothetical protein